MAAEKPPMQTTPLLKTISVPIEVPIDFEMAGAVVLVFDKQMQRPILDFPYQNVTLSMHCLNIMSNTILGHCIGAVQEKVVEKSRSGLWLPPNTIQGNG